MALVQKIEPKGIDKTIDMLQSYIYSNISWSNFNYESYPRAYRNFKNTNLIDEVFVGGKDYKEVFFDDRKDCTSYFIADSNVNNNGNGVYRQQVTLIVQINLKKCYPDIQHRADEEARMELLNVLKKRLKTNEILRITTGMRNVYGEAFRMVDDKTDMQPFHVFSVTLDLRVCECCNQKKITPIMKTFDNTFDNTFA
jgi:hypothetical protein